MATANELLTFKTFDATRIIFEDAKRIKTDDPKVKCSRIPLKYRYGDGTIGKLSIRTPTCFSWGIQENTKPENLDIVESYSIALTAYDANVGPTEEEQGTVDMFETILRTCQEHLQQASVKEAIDKYNMDALVREMEIYYRKKEKGKTVPGSAPTMYPKLQPEFEKVRTSDRPKIAAFFVDRFNKSMDPLTLLKKRCKVICQVTVDNIYVGQKPSMQLKADGVIVMEILQPARKLFPPPCEETEESQQLVIEPSSKLFFSKKQEEPEEIEPEEEPQPVSKIVKITRKK